MHPALLAVLSDPELTAAAKSVYAHLYAHTNGTLQAEVDREELLAGLRMAESTLRRNRGELARAGVLQSWYAQHGEQVVLVFELTAPRSPSERDEEPAEELEAQRRSPSERAPSDRDHLVRAADPSPRSPSARRGAPRSPSERAPSDRAERDDAQNAATALYGIRLKAGRLEVKNLPPDLGGGVGEPDPDRGGALLAACGIDVATAADLAAGHPFEQLVRHVARWQADLTAGKVNGPGALLYRVARGNPGKLPLTAAQLTAGLLAEHVTDEDLAEWHVTRPDSSYVPAGFEDIIQH